MRWKTPPSVGFTTPWTAARREIERLENLTDEQQRIIEALRAQLEQVKGEQK